MANNSPIKNGAPWAWFSLRNLKGGEEPTEENIITEGGADMISESGINLIIE